MMWDETCNELYYYIVEDIYDVAEKLQYEMQKFKEWKCAGSADGVKQAIKEITELKPHLIFIDWDVVGGSGFEVLQNIQNITNYYPFIIFNTAFQSEHPEIAEDLLNIYRPDAFISKPYWEKLTQQLPGLVTKAKLKSEAAEPESKIIWLSNIYGSKSSLMPHQIACIVQSESNPRAKIVYTECDVKGSEFLVTWKEIIGLLEANEVSFFVTNKRYSLVVKKFIESYNKPMIYLKRVNLKVEIVEDYVRSFEEWLEK